MIVSWNWLKRYVELDMSPEELTRRLMMTGLNHESSQPVDDDLAIDLEVTSNRPDCLGHLGIAREIAVLWDRPLSLPEASPREGETPIKRLASVSIECPDLCPRYTARVIRGVRIGPSPDWLARQLRTIGVATINNVVDITNYVLFECGQPLHAFDFSKLVDSRIVVRRGRPGEKIEAIDHKRYDLSDETCVIADARRAVAIGGVMGGAETEVTPKTTDLLIEAALFDPTCIRHTARRLGLHSPSSYRFERGLDPEGVDWASRRCCELILEFAGGELAAGSLDVGERPRPRPAVVLRLAQLQRVLGIDIPGQRARQILAALGCEVTRADRERIEVTAPSWRRDLSREIDLVEEVARIHGYDAIPEDVQVPMAPSARNPMDQALGRVRHVLTATGFYEAYTLSAVEEPWSEAFSPWTSAAALRSITPVLRRADQLRRSLVPSLLGARRINETLANEPIELFEIAKIYLPQPDALPEEVWTLAFSTGGDFFRAKGVIEELLSELHISDDLQWEPYAHPLLQPGRAARFALGGELLGFLGEVSGAGRKLFELRGPTAVAEIRVSLLVQHARLAPRYHPPSPYPAIERDVNLVVAESVSWAEVARVVRGAGGKLLERLRYRDTYRDPKRLGVDRKSLLFSLTLRDPDATLTGERADELQRQIVAACRRELGGELRE
jgi:phenylalanyl-tRNA synthetase beta chain